MSDGHARRAKPSRYGFSTRSLEFGDDCRGHLFTPDRPSDPPVVVLAPGAGLAWRPTLELTAERFAERGYAVLAFDHRGFGKSGDGRLINPSQQREDLDAAIDAAQDAPEVNGNRLALWGMDLSAGAALGAAADSFAVDAVIARFPVVRGAAFLPSWVRPRLRGLASGLIDYPFSTFDRLRGIGPADRGIRVPLFGDRTSVAAVTGSGVARNVRDVLGRDPGTTPARSLLNLQRYKGSEHLEEVRCPVLFVAGERDELAIPESVTSLSEPVRDASLVRVPAGHYDALAGRSLERTITHEIGFLDAEL